MKVILNNNLGVIYNIEMVNPESNNVETNHNLEIKEEKLPFKKEMNYIIELISTLNNPPIKSVLTIDMNEIVISKFPEKTVMIKIKHNDFLGVKTNAVNSEMKNIKITNNEPIIKINYFPETTINKCCSKSIERVLKVG